MRKPEAIPSGSGAKPIADSTMDSANSASPPRMASRSSPAFPVDGRQGGAPAGYAELSEIAGEETFASVDHGLASSARRSSSAAAERAGSILRGAARKADRSTEPVSVIAVLSEDSTRPMSLSAASVPASWTARAKGRAMPASEAPRASALATSKPVRRPPDAMTRHRANPARRSGRRRGFPPSREGEEEEGGRQAPIGEFAGDGELLLGEAVGFDEDPIRAAGGREVDVGDA